MRHAVVVGELCTKMSPERSDAESWRGAGPAEDRVQGAAAGGQPVALRSELPGRQEPRGYASVRFPASASLLNLILSIQMSIHLVRIEKVVLPDAFQE